MNNPRIGIWMVGACGGVSTLTMIGARAVARGLRPAVGMLTETPLFTGLDFATLDDLVFGGHEIRNTDLHCAAQEFAERAGILDPALLQVLRSDIERIDQEIRPGYLVNPGEGVQALNTSGWRLGEATQPRDVIAALQADWASFAERNQLDTVVVVNVSSTEPPGQLPIEYATLEAFEACLDQPTAKAGLTASVINAYAAPRRRPALHQLHALPWQHDPRPPRTRRTSRRAPHGSGRQDGRDAGEDCAGAALLRARPAGALLGGLQHARQSRRRRAQRPRCTREQDALEGPRAAPDPR